MGMKEETGKVQYHYGFYGAVHAEYEFSGIEMEYLQEHELGDGPVRLDMLVIKRESAPLTDPIGSFFRTHNVLDYKSPEDGLTIDDFYKAHGYALIYKSLGKTVNAIPLEEITVSIFRHAYPREMFKALEESGMTVEEKSDGIYYVTGPVRIPTQVVVTSRLPKGRYEAFKAIAKNAAKEDILKLLCMMDSIANPKIADYVSAVLHVSISVNEELFNEIKGAGIMTEAIERVFKKEMDEKKTEGKEEMVTEMLRGNEPVEKILKYSHMPIEQIMGIAKNIGISSLAL